MPRHGHAQPGTYTDEARFDSRYYAFGYSRTYIELTKCPIQQVCTVRHVDCSCTADQIMWTLLPDQQGARFVIAYLEKGRVGVVDQVDSERARQGRRKLSHAHGRVEEVITRPRQGRLQVIVSSSFNLV